MSKYVPEGFVYKGEVEETTVVEKPIHKPGYGWAWFGTMIMWFIVLVVLFWIIYYSLKPNFVLKNGTNEIDTGKVLLAAVITSIIVVIIIWLIKICTTKKN